MPLLAFDLFVRFLCLCMAIVAFMIARDFGLWRKGPRGCFEQAMIYIFASISWAGLITFMGGAIKIIFAAFPDTQILQEWRVLAIRLLAVAPMLAAVIYFYKCLYKSHDRSIKVERHNGESKG